MKKLALCLITACLLLTFQPFQTKAANVTSSPTLVVSKPAESEKAEALLLRLDEIKAMDKSKISPSEKKSLRIEVRTIKHQLNEIGGGVYLSAGTVIVILILLIIFL